MKQKLLKVIAGLSLVMMVLGAVTPGAFADDSGTATDSEEFTDHKKGHGSRGGPGIDAEGAIEEMEFESDEEEMEFLIEKQTKFINHRIEKLNQMLENIEDIEDENITEESIEEQIAEVEALLEEIEGAETLDELKDILETARESMMPDMKGERPEMEEMEFESDEEEMEFLIEKQTKFINHRIEKLNQMLENIEDIEDENITEESIEEQIAEVEALLEEIEGAETLDELKDILETARENNPQPCGHGGKGRTMNPGSQDEKVTAE